jgi:hypothetical protein
MSPILGKSVSKVDVCRFSGYHIDTVNILARKKILHQSPSGGLDAFSTLNYLIANAQNPISKQRLVYWFQVLNEEIDRIPDEYYVPTEEERLQIEAQERERNKSPFQRLAEAESAWNESQSRFNSERRNLDVWKAEVDRLREWIERSESNLSNLQRSEAEAKAGYDEAKRVYDESRIPFLQQVDSSEEVAPIVVSEEDRLDISHRKRTSKR